MKHATVGKYPALEYVDSLSVQSSQIHIANANLRFVKVTRENIDIFLHRGGSEHQYFHHIIFSKGTCLSDWKC